MAASFAHWNICRLRLRTAATLTSKKLDLFGWQQVAASFAHWNVARIWTNAGTMFNNKAAILRRRNGIFLLDRFFHSYSRAVMSRILGVLVTCFFESLCISVFAVLAGIFCRAHRQCQMNTIAECAAFMQHEAHNSYKAAVKDQTDFNCVSSQLKQANLKVRSNEAKCREVKDRLAVIEAELQIRDQQIEKVEKQLQLQGLDLQARNSELQKLRQEHNAQASQLKEVLVSLQLKQMQADHWTTEIKELNRGVKVKEREAELTLTATVRKDTQLQKLRKELSAKDAKLEEVQTQCNSLKDQVKTLEVEIQTRDEPDTTTPR